MSQLRKWQLDPYSDLTVDLGARRVSYTCYQMGSEGEEERGLEAFVEVGIPAMGRGLVSRTVAREVVAFVGCERLGWCDLEARLTVRVGDAVVHLWGYPRPEVHARGLEVEVARTQLAVNAFCDRYGLASGWLSDDSEMGGVVLARDTEIRLEVSGRLSSGTLAVGAWVNGVSATAGDVVFYDSCGAPSVVKR